MISASIRGGKVFGASYDSMSGGGACSFNRLVHTKSNYELKDFISDYHQVRLNSGALQLKRTEGGGGGDRSFWTGEFTELNKDVTSLKRKTQNGQLRASISSERYVFMEKLTEVEQWRPLCRRWSWHHVLWFRF